MITQGFTFSYLQEILQGIHLAADSYKLALFPDSADVGPDTTAYSSTGEISGTGYSAGGVALSGFTVTLATSSGVAVSITRSGSTATVTHTGHGYKSGQIVVISGATQTEYNRTARITVTDANTYTYRVSGTPATPATGSPVAAIKVAILDFTTDPSWASSTLSGVRGGLIYNTSRSNKSVFVIDFGADFTSTNGTFLITLPAATAAAALMRLNGN